MKLLILSLAVAAVASAQVGLCFDFEAPGGGEAGA
jgi:hypothetical protein